MSRRNLIAVVVAAHLCVLAVVALMGGCAMEKKEPKLMSAAPVQEARAPEGEPESILEPKGMVEEKDLLVSREPEMVPARAEVAATPVAPTPVPFVEERAGAPAAASEEAAGEERAAAIAEKVAAGAKAPEAEKPAAAKAEGAAPVAAAAAAGEAPAGRTHTVAPGESLWKIARIYGVTVAELAHENGLAPDTRIKAGRKLVIPAAGKASATAAPVKAESRAPAEAAAPAKPAQAERVAAPAKPAPAETVAAPAKPLERPVIRQLRPRVEAAKPAAATRVSTGAARPAPAAGAVRHVVKRGETLSLIAQHYRVPMRSIMAANRIKDAGKIRSGMVLVIPAR